MSICPLAATTRARSDPAHGEKPAQLVRKKATAVGAALDSAKRGQSGGGSAGRLGGLAAKAKAKSGKLAAAAEQKARQQLQLRKGTKRRPSLKTCCKCKVLGAVSRAGGVAIAVGGGVVAKAAAVKADIAGAEERRHRSHIVRTTSRGQIMWVSPAALHYRVD